MPKKNPQVFDANGDPISNVRLCYKCRFFRNKPCNCKKHERFQARKKTCEEFRGYNAYCK